MQTISDISVMKPRQSYPLCGLNSWKVGGKADFFCEPKTQEEVFHYLQWARNKKLPVTFLSGGTNVLISDQGVEGLVMNVHHLRTVHVRKEKGRLCINALAGVSKAEIMRIFLKHKLAPALFLCGLPGDVGGGVVMNAGIGSVIVPREFKDIVDWIKVIRDGEVILVQSEDIKWKYRSSCGWEPGLIYEVGMSWPIEPLLDLPDRLREMALRRAQSQPLKSASCGSVFKNPRVGEKSGALIEMCGLKGNAVGGAFVSEKHANFILNKGRATAMDIHLLIQHIQQLVHNKYNILLEPEVKYIGRWSAISFSGQTDQKKIKSLSGN